MGLSHCKYCLCSCLCRCCNRNPQNSVGIVPGKKLKLLLLGLAGSGKTEIAHYLCERKRLDYDSTNGAHNYSMMAMESVCSLTEIGGNEEMQKIWHHYYVGTMAVIYCFDMSSKYENLQKSFQVLQTVMKNAYIMGKPILLIATKADLADESIQLYDIENAFHIQTMALSYGSASKLCFYDPRTEHTDKTNADTLKSGLNWLTTYLLNNFNVIQMRLNCDKNMQTWEQQRNKLISEGKLNFSKYERFPKPSTRHKFCRLSHKRLRRSLIRPRTAPPKIRYISTIESSTLTQQYVSSVQISNDSSLSKVPNDVVSVEPKQERTTTGV